MCAHIGGDEGGSMQNDFGGEENSKFGVEYYIIIQVW